MGVSRNVLKGGTQVRKKRLCNNKTITNKYNYKSQLRNTNVFSFASRYYLALASSKLNILPILDFLPLLMASCSFYHLEYL